MLHRVIVLRHAKSDWNATHGSDHERPLNERGRREAAVMGIALARLGEIPDTVLTSSAARACETVALAADAGGWKSSVEVIADLYDTSPADALAVASGAPTGVERLMLVGHEPAWSGLVRQMTGAFVQMKTATAVAIDYEMDAWSSLPSASGQIAYILPARLLERGSLF